MRDFNLLWAGQSVSLLGDQVFLLALPLTAVQSLHATTFQVAALAALAKLPFLVIGLPAGVWVARMGLRRSMLRADVLRGLAVASLPGAAAVGLLSLPYLLVVALATGIGMVFFQVGYQSYPPLLIADDDTLHKANTKLSVSESTALLVGPGIGGATVGLLGAVRALVVDATSYAASVTTLLAIRHREEPPRPANATTVATAPPRPRLWQEVGDGLRFVAGQPVLRTIMVVGALYNLGVAMFDSLLVVFVVRELDLSALVLGLCVGLGGAGFPVGSLLARSLARRFGLGPSLIVSGVPSVLGLAIGASAVGGLSALILAAGILTNGIGQGSFAVNALTIRHLATPTALATRATAVHRFVTWGTLPVGSLIAGAVGSAFGLRVAMLAAAATAATCMIPLSNQAMRTAKHLDRVGDP